VPKFQYPLNREFTWATRFDNDVIVSWRNSMKQGAFRYNLDKNQLPTRYLEGRYGFLLQTNPNRIAQKRPSEVKPCLNLTIPFDKTKFNFTRIDKNEILFKMNRKRRQSASFETNNSVCVRKISFIISFFISVQ
jgi:hypothetical protein